MTSSGPNADELDNFRRQWQNEVSRKRRPAAGPLSTTRPQDFQTQNVGHVRASGPQNFDKRNDDDFEPRTYHDLPDVESDLKLGASRSHLDQPKPVTALDHYEQAVEKESLGNLGDSLQLYRTAFKLDDQVHQLYKKKHFPTPAPAVSRVSDNEAAPPALALPTSIPDLVHEYADSDILPPVPETDLSPTLTCHIASLPEELIMYILQHLAADDVAHLSRVSLICRRFAFLVMTDQRLWMTQCASDSIGFPAMHYKYTCDVEGNSIAGDPTDVVAENLARLSITQPSNSDFALSAMTQQLLRTHYAGSWRQMFRKRPRIRFGGCYISTVNYSRPGEVPANSLTWGSTIHIVTYYRYLRFFRDGTCISLLTPSEPIDVVHQLTMENLLNRDQVARSNLPPRVMKDALRGRWRLSGPGPGPIPKPPVDGGISVDAAGKDLLSSDEAEGILHVETEGVVPKYMWRIEFALGSAGRGTRNNKLAWRGFWNYNRLTDDWGEFTLRNDRPFYWSRVKSYEA